MKKKVVQFSIEYLQILDEKGKVDHKLEPKLKKEELLSLYTSMVKARMFDEKCLKLQRQGRMGTFAPVSGQEACQAGSAFALSASDWMVPSFREACAAIVRGGSLAQLLEYSMGLPQGGRVSEGGRDLPVSIPVGSQVLHATGIGMAMNIKKENAVALTYCGDGATSQGDFYEALNFAGVYQAPVVFFVQNNQWAISLPRSQQTHAETLAQKAIAAGISCIQVDGNDVLAVYVATVQAIKQARAGKGPTLIEAVTYRLQMHTTADDPTKYRSEKEVLAWKKKDPIDRFYTYLVKKKILSKSKDTTLRQQIVAEIDAAISEAEQQRASVDDMFNCLYKELTPQLKEQLEIAKKYAGGGE